ncbi:MAG: AAA family ATPase [Candidatus Heimdallarchaeota archaeon]|nr:AAA family ATPase [Candidatus Heimdallarchaeota archaeon]
MAFLLGIGINLVSDLIFKGGEVAWNIIKKKMFGEVSDRLKNKIEKTFKESFEDTLQIVCSKKEYEKANNKLDELMKKGVLLDLKESSYELLLQTTAETDKKREKLEEYFGKIVFNYLKRQEIIFAVSNSNVKEKFVSDIKKMHQRLEKEIINSEEFRPVIDFLRNENYRSKMLDFYHQISGELVKIKELLEEKHKNIYEFIWRPIGNITQEDFLGKTRWNLGKEYKDFYEERVWDSKLREMLTETKGNILIHGPPCTGKTRLVHYTLKNLGRPVIVTKPNENHSEAKDVEIPSLPDRLSMENKIEKILLLDNISALGKENNTYKNFLIKFHDNKDGIRIIATCRSGIEWDNIRNKLIRDHGLNIDNYFDYDKRLNMMKENDKHWAKNVLNRANSACGMTRSWDDVIYTGALGSIFIPVEVLKRRILSIMYDSDSLTQREEFYKSKIVTLRSIKLAYLLGLMLGENRFEIDWVKRIAEKKFEFHRSEANWEDILRHLENLELMEQKGEENGEYKWLSIEEIYLKKIIGYRYANAIIMDRDENGQPIEEKFSANQLQRYYNRYFSVGRDFNDFRDRVHKEIGEKKFQEFFQKVWDAKTKKIIDEFERKDLEEGEERFKELMKDLKEVENVLIKNSVLQIYSEEFNELISWLIARALVRSKLNLERYYERYNELLANFLDIDGYAEFITQRETMLEKVPQMELLKIYPDEGPNLMNTMPIAYIDLTTKNLPFNVETGRMFLNKLDWNFTGKVEAEQGQNYLVEDPEEEITRLIYSDKPGRDVYIFKELFFENDLPKIAAGVVKFRNVVRTTEVIFFHTFESEDYGASSFIEEWENHGINPFLSGLGRASPIAVDTVVIFAVERKPNIEYFAFVNKRSVGVRTYPEFFHVFPTSHFGPDLKCDDSDDAKAKLDIEEQFDCYLNFEREYMEEFFNYYGERDSIEAFRNGPKRKERLNEIDSSRKEVDHYYTGICFDIINFHLAICSVLIIHDPNWIKSHATEKLKRDLDLEAEKNGDSFVLNFETKDYHIIQLTENRKTLDRDDILQKLEDLNPDLHSLGQLMPPDGFGAFCLGYKKFCEIMRKRLEKELEKYGDK